MSFVSPAYFTVLCGGTFLPGRSTNSEGDAELQGIGRSLRNFRKQKEKMMRNPLRHVRAFIEEAKEDMGVDEGQYFNISDLLHKSIAWQQHHRGLQRFFIMMLETVKLLLKDEPEKSAVQLTQNLRALRQVVLDQGKWRMAWNLTYLPDPLSKRRFGGTARELEIISQFVRSLHDIEKRSRALVEEPGQEE